jgi:hypothetical protein
VGRASAASQFLKGIQNPERLVLLFPINLTALTCNSPVFSGLQGHRGASAEGDFSSLNQKQTILINEII